MDEFVVIEKLTEPFSDIVFVKDEIEPTENQEPRLSPSEITRLFDQFRQIEVLKVLNLNAEMDSLISFDEWVDEATHSCKFRNVTRRLIRDPSMNATNIQANLEIECKKERNRRDYIWACYENYIQFRNDTSHSGNFVKAGSGYYNIGTDHVNFERDVHIENLWKPEWANLFLNESVTQKEFFIKADTFLFGADHRKVQKHLCSDWSNPPCGFARWIDK